MTKFTESMSAILKAMNIAQVTRIITISAWYTNPETRQGKYKSMRFLFSKLFAISIFKGQYLFDNMWSKVPGLVNTLNSEGQMDEMLRQTDEKVSFTSVLVPTLSWDPMTDKEILTSVGNTWVEGASGLMPREGKKILIFVKISQI